MSVGYFVQVWESDEYTIFYTVQNTNVESKRKNYNTSEDKLDNFNA